MAESLLDFNILEQISLLVWAHTGNSDMAEKLATVKLAADLWKKLSGNEQMDELRNETILSISKYVKEHPHASQDELSNEIAKQITEFAKKVEMM
uniref:Uncharacterized protein n=1 Tax=Arion vulgaris TaxID=1028688 RepID=A0A0B7AM39_9EUPU